MIPFGEWLPDLPDFNNPGSNYVNNVIPGDESYLPLSDLTVHGISSLSLGMAAFKNSSGGYYNFNGGSSGLALLSGTSHLSVGTGYSLPAGELWKFTQYGDDAIACQIGDNPQKYTMGVDSSFSNLTTAFKARYCGVVREFLVFGNTIDTETVPNRLRWSAFGDHTNYTVSPTTQSDYQDLPSVDGQITGIVGGSYGIVFQENAIRRMTYVGAPIVFQIDKMENRGTKYPSSIIDAGALIAFLSDDGFFVFDGTRSVPIGDGKVNRTFFNDMDQNYDYLITSVHDPVNHLFIWGYVSRYVDKSITVVPDKLIIFNYSPNAKYRWSQAEVSHLCLGRALISGLTVVGDYSFWTSTDEYLACLAPTLGDPDDPSLFVFTGAPLDATIETGEFQVNPGIRTALSKLRAHILLNSGGTQADLWTQRTPAESNVYQSITVNSVGLYVAVSSTGTNRVMVSNDGITWIARSAASASTWISVCWASSLALFCATAVDGSVMTSTDGSIWTSRTPAETNQWYSVCWSSSLTLFVAVARALAGGGTHYVMTSPDGINWTSRDAVTAAWESVCWSPDLALFCAVSVDGKVMTSSNGTTWTERTAAEANWWASVCWSPGLGLFCAVSRAGTHTVMTSPDGITWTAQNGVGADWNSVCWSEELGIFVAVSGTVSTTSPENRVMVSEDGEYWTGVKVEPHWWRSVVWSDYLYRFAAVGKNVAMTSQGYANGEATLQIGERDNANALVKWSNEISAESNGNYAVRSNARFHRVRANITGTFDNAQGIEILKAQASGGR